MSRQTFIKRMAETYLFRLQRHERMFLEAHSPALKKVALAAFDLDAPAILASRKRIAQHAASDHTYAHLLVGFSMAGVNLWGRRLHPRTRLDWSAAMRTAAELIGDKKALGASYGHEGLAHMSNGALRDAQQAFTLHHKIAKAASDVAGITDAVGNLGTVFLNLRIYHEAQRHYLVQLETARMLKDRSRVLSARINLGLADFGAGAQQKAITGWHGALRLAQSLRQPSSQAIILSNLVMAYTEDQRPKRAMRFARKAVALADGMNDPSHLAHAHGNLAILLDELGQHQEAVRHHQLALDGARRAGLRPAEGRALSSYAVTLSKQMKVEEAERAFLAAISLFQSLGWKEEVDTARHNLSVVKRTDAPVPEPLIHDGDA